VSIASGQRLLHYRIVEKIGQGGMGEVYLAEDTTLKRRVALKVLPAGMASDPTRLERFQREAEAVASLNHPHIVTIYSVEQAGETRFLTMELVEGTSLDRQRKPGGLPIADVFEIGIALADALAAAHDKGVVHRDLKPPNVMRSAEGRIKVLDFGLAKLAAESSSEQQNPSEAPTRRGTLTGEGTLVGTVPYMSPEQVQGEPVDHRTDIFSLGVLLYELSTGARPFSGANTAELVSSILRDRPRPATEMREQMPAHLGRIIKRCLQKERDNRYSSASDVRNELTDLRAELESERLSEPPRPLPQTVTASSHSRKPLWAGIAVTILVAAAAAVWFSRTANEPAPAMDNAGSTAATAGSIPAGQTDGVSIAVLPFVDMSRDGDQEYFADGLSDELLGVLSRIPGLRVAARTSSFSFKDKDVKIADIGRELKVATVLEGSVRKAGDRVRITAQLIGVTDGFQLWSETYDRELEDIFEVQNDIAGSVARALQVTLLGTESASRQIDPDAYNAYLQGKFFADRLGEESLRAAVGHYEQALEIEPDWAEAWVGLAVAESRRADFGYVQFEEGYVAARSAAEQAVRLDPDLATAHAVAGWIKLSYDWDWVGADAAYRRALKLEPGNAAALGGAAHLARTLGRYDEAVALSRREVELDPLSPWAHLFLGEHALLAGRFDEATVALEKTLKLNPSQTAAHWSLCWNLLEQSRPEEALVEIEHEVDPFFRLHGRVLIYQTLGRESEAESALQQLIEGYADIGAFQIATGYAYRDELDKAFEWLERAYDQHDTGLPGIKSVLASRLQNDPRWKPLLDKIGLPE